ncbi:hypothetical protein EV702DRAFT_1041171 [Suillus placidus]|uniref:Uncharacterized protein n=1 Tax=Suillus placidus TaxID=48579 RepID=A0A9P7A4K1_9AGAM|nr:hypothetical protein EV702DRAFT_1041171 [Suillus placidus]
MFTLEPSCLPLTLQPTVRMLFNIPPSSIKESSQECRGKDGPSQCKAEPPLDILEPAPALDRTIGRTRSRHVPQTKRARSPSSDETDDSILRPVTPPPIINHLAHFVKRTKLNPTPCIKDGSNTQDRCFFNNQLSHRGSLSVSEAQWAKDVLQRCSKNLSSEAAAQAVVTMHADVEWRRVCCLATAWEIYASEEHLKFLHMVLEDEGERYASASSEPFGTSVEGLISCSEEELKDQIDFGVAAYSHDVTSFAVGDTHSDYLENTPTDSYDSDDSGIALTHSEEDRSRVLPTDQMLDSASTTVWSELLRHKSSFGLERGIRLPKLYASKSRNMFSSNRTRLTTKPRKFLQLIKEKLLDMSDFDSDWQHGSQNPYSPGQPSQIDFGWTSLHLSHSDSGQQSSLESLPQPELNLPACGYFAQVGLINLPPLQAHDPQLEYGHGDLQAATSNSPNVNASVSDNAVSFNYEQEYHSLHPYDGYSNTHWQGNANFGLQPSTQSFTYGHSFGVSVADSDGPGYNQGSSIEPEVPKPSYEGSASINAAAVRICIRSHWPHAFADGHNTVVVHHAGPIYNSTALHIMHDPQPPPDASNCNSMASSSSHNLQPPMSSYYFARSHSGSNDPQPPSDPMPEVTKRLGQGIRPSNHKTKRPRTKFIASKLTPQESPLVITRAPSSLGIVFISSEFIRNVEEDARITMFKFLFEQNLFPSATENSQIAMEALDSTVARYSGMIGGNGADLVHWKSGPDGISILTKMKMAVKEIHSSFEQVAAFSWISAYALGHDISMTQLEMQTVRVSRLTALLSHFLFADEVIHVTMDDGTIISYRIPFGHPASLRFA